VGKQLVKILVLRAGYNVFDLLWAKVDGLAKSRHTRESGYPACHYLSVITGFPLSRE
jgi:hypothetical protein